MSKVPHHLLCNNYQKYKTHQSCLTATASKQGDRVLVLFPDAVRSASSSLHFLCHSLIIVQSFKVPSYCAEPTSSLQSRTLSCPPWHLALFLSSCAVLPVLFFCLFCFSPGRFLNCFILCYT